jgi:hypothetical protein
VDRCAKNTQQGTFCHLFCSLNIVTAVKSMEVQCAGMFNTDGKRRRAYILCGQHREITCKTRCMME